MTPTRSGRVDVLWRMAIASLRAGNPRARGERAAAGAAAEAGFRNRARRLVLARATRRMPQARRPRLERSGRRSRERYPFSYYGARAAIARRHSLPRAVDRLSRADAARCRHRASRLRGGRAALARRHAVGCGCLRAAAERRLSPRRCRRAARGAGVRSRRRLLVVFDADVVVLRAVSAAARDESSGRFLGARVSARVLAGSLGGGGSPQRRSASDDRPRAAGIAFQPDGALTRRRRRPVPGHAVHRGRARSRRFPIRRQWTASCSPTSAPSWPQSFSRACRRAFRARSLRRSRRTTPTRNACRCGGTRRRGCRKSCSSTAFRISRRARTCRQVLTNYAMYQRSAQSASPRK